MRLITQKFDTNQYYQLADGKYMLLDDSGRENRVCIARWCTKILDQNGEQVKDAIIVDPDTNLSYYFNATQGVAVKMIISSIKVIVFNRC